MIGYRSAFVQSYGERRVRNLRSCENFYGLGGGVGRGLGVGVVRGGVPLGVGVGLGGIDAVAVAVAVGVALTVAVAVAVAVAGAGLIDAESGEARKLGQPAGEQSARIFGVVRRFD